MAKIVNILRRYRLSYLLFRLSSENVLTLCCGEVRFWQCRVRALCGWYMYHI